MLTGIGLNWLLWMVHACFCHVDQWIWAYRHVSVLICICACSGNCHYQHTESHGTLPAWHQLQKPGNGLSSQSNCGADFGSSCWQMKLKQTIGSAYNSTRKITRWIHKSSQSMLVTKSDSAEAHSERQQASLGLQARINLGFLLASKGTKQQHERLQKFG